MKNTLQPSILLILKIEDDLNIARSLIKLNMQEFQSLKL